MSLAKPWDERKESLLQSFEIGTSDRSFQTYDLCTPSRLRPISVPAAVEFLKNNTSSGFPDLTKKRNVKPSLLHLSLEGIYNVIKLAFQSGNFSEVCCILFTRTQEMLKTRNIWGYAIIVTLFEMMFYRPILEIQSRQFWRAALRRPDDVSYGVTKVIDYCLRNGYDIISIDFSAYDNSIKEPLSLAAFSCIKRAYQSRYHEYIDLISRVFVYVPILTPDGVMYGPHGVPSGSTFTNEVDSIVQFGIARECQYIPDYNMCQIQGDDGVHSCMSGESGKLKDHFRYYGLVVNDDKSYVAKDWAVYLQQLFHVDYRDQHGIINGIYPLYRALTRILFLERFDDFKSDGIDGTDYFSIRTISILEQCKHHPLFREFVSYVWSLDKYKLTVSDQGLANYVRRLAYQEGKDLTFKEWTYGSNISGLKSFESFKIIQSLNSKS